MPTLPLSTDWRYLSTLTPEQLAEHLPMQRGLNELDRSCSLTWSKVTVSGFELSCSFDTGEESESVSVTGRMQPHEGKTLIVIAPPRDTRYWTIMAVVYVVLTIAMLWAGLPGMGHSPILWLIIPLALLVVCGGFSFFHLRRWRMHRRTVEASLCRLLQAERMQGT